MTDEQKLKAEPAEKDKRIAELEGQLATANAKAKAPADSKAEADEDLTPTPTQDELDRVKSGEHMAAGATYKTRQAKA